MRTHARRRHGSRGLLPGLLLSTLGATLALGVGAAKAQIDSMEAALPRFHPAISNVHLITENPGEFKKWDNAECYFAPDGRSFIFQGTRDGRACDAIYTMDLDGHGVRMVSNGRGRTTCSFYSPDRRWIVYSSTYLADASCPPPPDMSQGYTWALYPGYDIFRVPVGGGEPERLTRAPGYDAEAVYRPDGKRILFTSMRHGDLDLYDMDPDGGDIRQLTDIPGYDGGAFYTADSRQIVFRARHPEGQELADYQRLLKMNLIRPGRLDLYVMDADGGNLRQLTHDGDRGVTNWAPFPHPSGKYIIFASNRDDYDGTVPGSYGYNFELYTIGMDGKGITRLTFHRSFDGFPMFSPDGTKLVWCGNFVAARPRDTDVVLADWNGAALP